MASATAVVESESGNDKEITEAAAAKEVSRRDLQLSVRSLMLSTLDDSCARSSAGRAKGVGKHRSTTRRSEWRRALVPVPHQVICDHTSPGRVIIRSDVTCAVN